MAVNRERKMVKTPQTSFDVEYKTLSQIQEELTHLLEEYGADAVIDWYQYPYEDGQYLYVWNMMPETDKDMAARIAQEEKSEVWREQRDKEEFERLQAKFGKA